MTSGLEQANTHFRITTGITNLDFILRGGLPQHRMYVVEGDPGAGKTTLALQFLMEGARLGERCLYVTLSETANELQEVAASHGWALDGIELLELDTLAERLHEAANYTVYHPADVELGETVKHIRSEVERLNPSRVVLDSVSELKILSETNARYRREILGLKQFFAQQRCTALVLDDRTTREGEQQLQSIAHGVIRLERHAREYGDTRRQIHIVKMRGVHFRDGFHDLTIDTGGLVIYPRLSAIDHPKKYSEETVESGVEALDRLLGPGLDRGSSSLIMGPAGCGKTTLSTQFALAALARGEAVSYFLFEESQSTFCHRAAGLGLDVRPYVSSGLLRISQIDPAALSPGEFANRVRCAVEQHDVSMVMIDSLNGYMSAMPSERFLLIQMHELLTYLGQQGVVTLLILAQHGMLGSGMQTPVDVSFLADTVILLRFFEAQGEVRQAISVVKKRRSAHERTIREMRLGPGGVRIGAPLREFEGVLTGVPKYRGKAAPLLTPEDVE
ncbi:MAG TPA: ATPase domain-containing protein [Bryobacteraceae bacterium]|nr:ATPase domain-containing protein [Bryobacteraceae bacterium]